MRIQLFNIEEDPLEHHDRWNDPACSAIAGDLAEELCQDWDQERMLRTSNSKKAEQHLIGQWVKKNQPAEPDDLWYDTPPENVIVDRTDSDLRSKK